jgi:hypothetical protein
MFTCRYNFKREGGFHNLDKLIVLGARDQLREHGYLLKVTTTKVVLHIRA